MPKHSTSTPDVEPIAVRIIPNDPGPMTWLVTALSVVGSLATLVLPELLDRWEAHDVRAAAAADAEEDRQLSRFVVATVTERDPARLHCCPRCQEPVPVEDLLGHIKDCLS